MGGLDKASGSCRTSSRSYLWYTPAVERWLALPKPDRYPRLVRLRFSCACHPFCQCRDGIQAFTQVSKAEAMKRFTPIPQKGANRL
jgi:hypothetical protein